MPITWSQFRYSLAHRLHLRGPENVEMLQAMWGRCIPPSFNSNWRESIPGVCMIQVHHTPGTCRSGMMLSHYRSIIVGHGYLPKALLQARYLKTYESLPRALQSIDCGQAGNLGLPRPSTRRLFVSSKALGVAKIPHWGAIV